MLRSKTVRLLAGALALAVAFAAGWAGARQQFETRINKGRVNALNSVGENLFGAAVFAAHAYPPDPARGVGELVQIDLADDTMIPVRVNVFYPPDPTEPEPVCMSYFQLELSEQGVRLFVDPDVVSEAFDSEIVFESLEGFPPDPIRCSSSDGE